MKRALVSLFFSFTLVLNLSGCTTTSQLEPSKPATDIFSTQTPESPKQAVPEQKDSPPNTETPSIPSTTLPNGPKSSLPEVKQVTDQIEVPSNPTKPGLAQGPISLLLGEVLPEFILPDLQGNNINSSTIITKHKLTLINFWTTT